MYDVFLSYSSTNERDIEYLAHRLTEEGIRPFLDKWSLIPGRLWQPALEQALSRSRSVAIFIGAEGLGPWTRQEMLIALDRGARELEYGVIPVLLPGARSPDPFPDFLFQRHRVEFRQLDDPEAFRRLVAGIRGVSPGCGGAREERDSHLRSMAPARESFVRRQEYEEVVAALCAKGEAGDAATIGLTAALQGAGGFGKTALAQELCYDSRVRERYPDGILWAQMKEDGDTAGRLAVIRDLIRWWTGGDPPAFETAGAAGGYLRERLKSKRVLLVVDDVWKPEDVAPFLGLDPGSALLVTTRHSRALPPGTLPVRIDAMTSSEAVELLGEKLPMSAEADLVPLAARLGEWALLLKLVNRQLWGRIQRGMDTLEAIRWAKEALEAKGLTFFDQRDSARRNQAVAWTLELSLSQLSEEERARYGKLAIFPEDLDIPLSVLERLWALDSFETEDFCARLSDLSLLLRFDLSMATIRLHDVVWAYLVEKHQSDLRVFHRRLLDVYLPASGRWSDLPSQETYLWRHLADHLTGAGKEKELRELLFDFDFLQAKLEATDTNALLVDCSILAETDREVELVGDALRLSAHALVKDTKELGGQLLGRLLDREEPKIRHLLQKASKGGRLVGLHPRFASLTKPGAALVRILKGHRDQVTAVAALDNRRALSASKDGSLRLWNLDTAQSQEIIQGDGSWIVALGLLKNGRIVSASAHGKLQLWDLESKQVIASLEGHTGLEPESPWSVSRKMVTALVVLADQQVVSSASDGSLCLWNCESGKYLRAIGDEDDWINALTVLDGGRLVSASRRGVLRIGDLSSSSSFEPPEIKISDITALVAVGDRQVVSGSTDGKLILWDVEDGQPVNSLGSQAGEITALAVLQGKWILCGTEYGTLLLWDTDSGYTLRKSHGDHITALAALDHRRVISAASDYTLRLWNFDSRDVSQRHEEENLSGHLSVTVNDQRIVSASDNVLRLWDLHSGETIKIIRGHRYSINTLKVVDDRRVVSASESTLRLWDLDSGKTLKAFERPGWGWEEVVLAVLERQFVVFVVNGRSLFLWHLDSGRISKNVKVRHSNITAVASLDRQRVVLSCENGSSHVVDLDSKQIIATLDGDGDCITALAAVGERIVSGTLSGALRLWDLASGKVSVVSGHSGKVSALAALDGDQFISASIDGALHVRDVQRGHSLCSFTLDSSPRTVTVPPSRSKVVVSDQTGRTHVLALIPPTPSTSRPARSSRAPSRTRRS